MTQYIINSIELSLTSPLLEVAAGRPRKAPGTPGPDDQEAMEAYISIATTVVATLAPLTWGT